MIQPDSHHPSQTTASFDLVVIGAGVAGVAAAERLAREAEQRGKHASILVLEAAPGIGVGASGGLQGWFHSGALYATLACEVSQRNCHDSAALLQLHYSQGTGLLPNPITDPTDDWFGDQVEFLVERTTASGDPTRCSEILQRIKAFGSLTQLRDDPQHPDQIRILTEDCAVDVTRVLQDLAGSAANREVEFRFNHRVTQVAPDGTINGITTDSNATFEVRANRVLVTGGDEMAHFPAALRPGLKRRSGIVVAATPALSPRNITRIACDPTDNISHIVHALGSRTYSAMGDSTVLDADPSHTACQAAAEGVIRKAAKLFGPDALQGRRFSWHGCTKIELDSNDPDATPLSQIATNATTSEPQFGPAVWPSAHSPNIHAMIPTKFSLFPLAAQRVVETLGEAFFADLRPARYAAASTRPTRAAPRVLPPHAERLLAMHGDPARLPSRGLPTGIIDRYLKDSTNPSRPEDSTTQNNPEITIPIRRPTDTPA